MTEKGKKGRKVIKTSVCYGSTNRFEAWNDHAPYQQWNTREENLKREHEEK